MKKIIILIIGILLLSGCDGENKYSDRASNPYSFRTYVDEETCIEYFISDDTYNSGNVVPKYNRDGTLKLNKQCLKEQE